MRPVRLVTAAALSLALLAPAGPATPLKAEAAGPPAATAPSSIQPLATARQRDTDLSAGRKADIKAVSRIRTNAWSDKKRTLNYRKAMAYDNGRYKARRKFARAILYTGGKITYLSRAERAKIMAYKPKDWSVSPADISTQAIVCKGASKVSYVNPRGPRFIVKYWFDSCETSALLAWAHSCAVLGGLMAGLTIPVPQVAAFLAVVATLCVIGGETIDYYQKISDREAIWVKDDTHLLYAGAQ